jgi:hypothetical protein
LEQNKTQEKEDLMKTSTSRIEKSLKNKNRQETVPAKPEGRKPVDAQFYAESVEKKAYELYEKRGCVPGQDWDDWFAAERIVEKELISAQ